MVEVGAADPEDPSRRYLTGHEMATRLAFFLTDSTPAPWLLDAADDGLLDDAAGIREVATMLLEEPTAKVALDNYFSEVLRLRQLDTLAKDPGVWPQWSPGLAQAMRTETLLLLQDIIWQRDGDFRDFLDAPYTFANNQVGPLYGLMEEFVARWSSAEEIDARRIRFRIELARVLGKLAWRMMKENRELYPMADAEIRRADSTFA